LLYLSKAQLLSKALRVRLQHFADTRLHTQLKLHLFLLVFLALPPLNPILGLCISNCLPLHIAEVVSPTRTKRHYVVDDVPMAWQLV
jgi:hypothetical protein